MKKYLIAIIVLAAAITGVVVSGYAAQVNGSFEPAATEEYEVCLFASDLPNIEQRRIDGTLSAFGQCTTEIGQAEIIVANIVPGKMWYFAAVSRDPVTHAIIGSFTPELALDVPLDIVTLQPMPVIVDSGQEIILHIQVNK